MTAPDILTYLKFFNFELVKVGSGAADIEGMLIRQDVFEAWKETYAPGIDLHGTMWGVPFHVEPFSGDAEVVFFTDSSVWKRFLRHTDQ